MNVTKLIPRSMGERIGFQYRGLMPRSRPWAALWRMVVVLGIALALAFFSIALAAGEKEPITGKQIQSEQPRMQVDGAPLTAVVVTVCSQVVVVYMTMPSGVLIRFDQSDGVDVKVLIAAADTAKTRERVEVGCDVQGTPRFERKGDQKGVAM